MNKLCPKCHTQNREDSFVCTKCGYRMPVGAEKEKASAPRFCPAGKHPMDPDWPECPYCGDPANSAVDDEVTKTYEPQRPQRQSTRFNAGGPEAANTPQKDRAVQQTPGRRMVGLMVTYSWRPEGQIFPIYEGRNYLGKDADCEIRGVADQGLSGKHAAIFYRGKTFTITDEKSMNGTFVNGAETPITGMPLANYDEVRTASTSWRFIIIEPQKLNGE